MPSNNTPHWTARVVEHERSGYSKGAGMQHVLIIQEVEVYPTWKAIYDQAADMRKRAGQMSYQWLRYDTDVNKIVHFPEWSSLDKARRFFESPELVEIRRKPESERRLHIPARDRTGGAILTSPSRGGCHENAAPLGIG